ncbi:MAG TPA: pyridoxal phosphate-dependent aminotransferase [Acidobacteriota bacterium]|nr:pyridoxal phosphate-dependent aminotransferase [Acidobacteriota bacterium]
MFSRIAAKLHGESNALYKLRDRLKSEGHAIQDLISGNINDQGFGFPQTVLEEILVQASRGCEIYKPDSFGQRQAREAVAEYYRSAGHGFDADRVLITPGTSFSYWYCFKLLADEGDEILCPCPSYPLFDYIALLSGVRLVPYRLGEARQWAIDIDRMEACISTRTRALVLISPHNPTGHVASSEEIAALADVARRHELAIISDEVFSEFLLCAGRLPRPAQTDAPLIFTLNGFSKMFALPGLKFGWMAVSGDPDKVREALRTLELISDTFLPVNEIIQAAAPEIFKSGKIVAADFGRRIHDCWLLAEDALGRGRSFDYVRPEGGFYVTLRLENSDEERAAELILKENHLLLHPGYFYDMDPHHLILSFVQAPEIIREAFPRLVKTIDSMNPGHGK